MNPAVDELAPLDWNARWKQAAARRWQRSEPHRHYWNRRATAFGERDLDSPYTRAFLQAMEPQPEWTVLDVGCGSGALALPLAGRVRSITAMDFSDGMLAQLMRRFGEMDIQNIHPVHGAWEDDWEALGIGTHDVAIASRSLVVEDLETALVKLDGAARRRVFLTSVVGDGPRDRRAVEAIGREFHRGPDYIFVYNLLHQMGICASVGFIDAEPQLVFRSREEAWTFHCDYLGDLDAGEQERLAAYLDRELVDQEGRLALRQRAPVRWALISWDKAGRGLLGAQGAGLPFPACC